jgi:hypothetical protein
LKEQITGLEEEIGSLRAEIDELGKPSA